jgi:hypothetical protein
MRKLLVVCLVLGMASLASAEVLSLSTVDLGASGGRDGTVGNELLPGDILGVEVWLNTLGTGSYAGYWIDGLDIALTASGPGSLDLDFAGVQTQGAGRLYGAYGASAVVETTQKIAIDSEASFNGWTPYDDGDNGPDRLLWGFLFTCDGDGAVDVALELDGPAVPGLWNYAGIGSVNFASTASGYWKYPGTSRYWSSNPNLFEMTNADFGSLIINQVPEPFTMGILGLGGLALIRRRLS